MKRSVSLHAAACLALAALGANASVRASPALSQTVPFDIEAPSMAEALIQFTQQSGLQLAFPTEGSAHLSAHKIIGTYTPAVALEKLLEGSGLKYEFANARTVLIKNPVTTSATTSSEEFRVAQTDQGLFTGSSMSKDEQTLQPGSGPSDQLQEIIVTAQRRDESIDKVPVSLTALSQRTMDDLHIENLSDLATIVPGLVINTPSATADSNDIAVRGIYSNGNAPTTQIYIDETPIAVRSEGAEPTGQPIPLIFDLDRVEVLRGPQGTLFGSSAMGGAIRFITPQPSLTETSGAVKGEIEYTKNGDISYEVGAAYGAPVISGTAGFRVSAWFQSEGGYIDQVDPLTGQILKSNSNSSNSYVIRPAFTIQPVDGLTITPSAFLQYKHAANQGDSYWIDSNLDIPHSGENYVWGGILQPSTDDLRVASLAIKWDLGTLSFQSDTSYLDREKTAVDDISPLYKELFTGAVNPNGYTDPFLYPSLNSFYVWEINTSYNHAFQQEFRVTSQDPSARISWVAGTFFRSSINGEKQFILPDFTPLTMAIADETSLEYFGIPDYVYKGQSYNSYDNYHTTDQSEAIFGDVAVNIVGGLKVNAGVRVEHLLVHNQTQFITGPTDTVYDVYGVLLDQKATPVTPRFSVTYQINDDDMVYASAAKGFRPGGGNSPVAVDDSQCQPSLTQLGFKTAPTSFNSDSLWSYEVGTKDLLFQRRLSIEASGFYIRWSNIQTALNLLSCSEPLTINQGKAISEGFDLQFNALVADGLKVGGSVGYTDAYYPNAYYGLAQGGPAPLVNYAGEKLGSVLPWTASINTNYARDIGWLWDRAKSYIRLDYRWESAATYPNNPNVESYDPDTTPYPPQENGILNVRLGVTHGDLDVSAFVNNVTNAQPRLSYTHDIPGSPLFYGITARPLTAGVTAWFRF